MMLQGPVSNLAYVGVFLMMSACAGTTSNQPDGANPVNSADARIAEPDASGLNVAGRTSSASAAVLPGTARDFEVNVGDRVFFDYDRSDLSPISRDTLRKQAAWLLRYPAVTLLIEGHCDERGTREYNLALGARRASAVKNYLITVGITPNRLDTVSYGKERPFCAESNEQCWRDIVWGFQQSQMAQAFSGRSRN